MMTNHHWSPSDSEASVFWGDDGTGESLRVSDAERYRCVEVLRRHAATGRLDLDELDVRFSAAYAARARRDITALIDDLPPVDHAEAGPRAQLTRALLRQAALVASVCLVIALSVWLATGAGAPFWPGWVTTFIAVAHVTPSAVRGCGPRGDAARELSRRAQRRQRVRTRRLAAHGRAAAW